MVRLDQVLKSCYSRVELGFVKLASGGSEEINHGWLDRLNNAGYDRSRFKTSSYIASDYF